MIENIRNQNKNAMPSIKESFEESGFVNNFLIDIQPSGHNFYGEKLYPLLINHLS